PHRQALPRAGERAVGRRPAPRPGAGRARRASASAAGARGTRAPRERRRDRRESARAERRAAGRRAHRRAAAVRLVPRPRERIAAMLRLNLALLAVLVVCALSLVTSRHDARRLFVELEREQARARQLETEYGQLQLEQSTWGMPARVEKIARENLRM